MIEKIKIILPGVKIAGSTTVADRASKGKQNGHSDKIIEVEGTDEQLTLLNLLKIPNVKIFDPKKHRLTLAVLLEVLDGVMEMDGRMLVITTNYPERLDKALIRPGRIDMRLEFGRCIRDCLVDMYQHFFQTTIPESLDKDSLPDKKWTPAETIRVFLHHMRDPPQGLQYLITAEPEEGLDIGALVHSREKKVQSWQRDKKEDVDDDEEVVDEVNNIANLKHGDMTAKEDELYEYVHRIGRRSRVGDSGLAGSLAKILKSRLADAASNAPDDGNKSKGDDTSAALDDDKDCG